MPGKYVSVAIKGGVAVVTIERLDLLDGLDRAAVDETRETVAALGAHPAVGCLFFRALGDGPLPVTVVAEPDEDVPSLLRRIRAFNSLLLELAYLPKPTVAAICGSLTGLACNLALACDFRLAAEEAELGQTYLRAGLPPHGGASYLWLELAGLARANEVLLSARTLDAASAQRYRLVTRVVPAAELEAAALHLATELSGGAPLALAMAKGLTQSRQRGEMEAQLEAEGYALVSALLSGKSTEGG